jgi:membrane-associated phospholipid phosphatase
VRRGVRPHAFWLVPTSAASSRRCLMPSFDQTPAPFAPNRPWWFVSGGGGAGNGIGSLPFLARPLRRRLSVVAVLRRRPTASERVAIELSRLGTRGLVWFAVAPIVARFARRRSLPTLAATAVATSAADALALGARELFGRKRPCSTLSRRPAPCPATPSFPSDHAATAAAGATVLSSLEPRAAPLLLPFAGAVAYSRVRLRLHYASDVIAGAVLGAACASATRFVLGLIASESSD